MFCTKCGKELTAGSKFCKFCGAEVKDSEAQKSIKVAFHRQKKFVGCLVPMYIHIDKKLVATLDNDQTVEVDIPCGTHSVIVEMWSAISESNVEFSSEYSKMYIEVGIKMGMMTNKAEILNIKEEK